MFWIRSILVPVVVSTICINLVIGLFLFCVSTDPIVALGSVVTYSPFGAAQALLCLAIHARLTAEKQLG